MTEDALPLYRTESILATTRVEHQHYRCHTRWECLVLRDPCLNGAVAHAEDPADAAAIARNGDGLAGMERFREVDAEHQQGVSKQRIRIWQELT